VPLSDQNWAVLADSFPPTLVTNTPKTRLEPGQTPNATGLKVTDEGYLLNAAIPSMSTRVLKTYTIGGDTWEWHYNRIWRISGTQLLYGAPEYTAIRFKQGIGHLDMQDDAETPVKIMEIGNDGLVVFKTTGAYIVSNAADHGGNFVLSDFLQEAKIADGDHVMELDGIVYYCNVDGVFTLNSQGQVEEISFPIRGSVTPAAVAVDYKNKLIRIGNTHIFDVRNNKWFTYNSSSSSVFVYDTPKIKSGAGEPFVVQALLLEFDWATGDTSAKVQIQYKVEDRDFSEVYDLSFDGDDRGDQEGFLHVLEQPDTGRSFQLRVVSLPTNVKLKRIQMRSDEFTQESRDS